MVAGDPPACDLTDLEPQHAVFDGRIALVGAKAERAGDALQVDLAWQALERAPADYTAFVHLIDAAGEIVAQHDQPPAGAGDPTRRWVPGETVRAAFTLRPPVGTELAGLRLRVGLYEPASGRQLPVGDAGEPYVILACS